ncbi:uncharacterized protein EDB91DRAFT_544075 [Suillus paluster]|uniref:uncharacterized protein n=1 Tax=Suillus paluster TaxID=48578 RepID=UPI001B873852|nr:uncharacterized protein EDB91DRAFT_544075 [Suillus paluster]KAG1735910.1 hypothetical protein EDB91DRAFT_544075 [Suillus paluster]
MVPPWMCSWWNHLSRSYGNQWCNSQLTPRTQSPCRYPQYLRLPSSRVQHPHRLGTYLFTNEMKDKSAGLLAAVPDYISHSVAGSYDNEVIAIFFLLVFTFFAWIRALKQGSAFWGTIAAFFFNFYMVTTWGMPSASPIIKATNHRQLVSSCVQKNSATNSG